VDNLWITGHQLTRLKDFGKVTTWHLVPKGKKMEYCDNCAKELDDQNRCAVESLSADIASANKGESGVLCPLCYFVDVVVGILNQKGDS
jgi:hypothetical protein